MGKREATFEFVKDYYTSDLRERDSAESKWFLSWLQNINGDSVLSLGCGPNLLDDSLFFMRLPKTLVGVDINQNNIDFIKNANHSELEKCREFLQMRQVKIELHVGDIFDTRPDFVGRFDAVYAMGVIGMYESHLVSTLLKITAVP